MLRRGPDTHRRLARPFAAPRPYRADRRRELPPQGQAKSRKYQSKKLEFGTPGWVSFTPTIPTKVGQISTGVDSVVHNAVKHGRRQRGVAPECRVPLRKRQIACQDHGAGLLVAFCDDLEEVAGLIRA